MLVESHILEDVNRCIVALREQETEGLERAAGAVRGRAARLAHIVAGEMDSYEPGAYTDSVMGHVQHLTRAGKAEGFSHPSFTHCPCGESCGSLMEESLTGLSYPSSKLLS